MKRTEDPNRTVDKHAAGKDGFTNKAAGIGGSLLLADFMDMLQEEIAICIELNGGTLKTGTSHTYPTDYGQLYLHGTRTGIGWYGNGADGDVDTGAGGATLTRDMYYDNLDVGNGDIDCAGYRIFVKGILTFNGTGVIKNNGADGAAGAGGAGAPAGSIGGGTAGGGGGGGGVGNPGTNQTDSIAAVGGAGGDGGGPIAAGVAGTVTAPGAGYGSLLDMSAARNCKFEGVSGSAYARGGSGGGGGGGQGGGGGGGAGIVFVAARNIVFGGNGGIQAHGGAGADAIGANGGGGGGGGGGMAIVMARTIDTEASITATGGAGGALNGTGANGSAGVAGEVLILY